ncbi:MAG: indole-3-glycerol phosphate synthase TrpC [Candidatus Hinthialibacter antarcticus]|nr:indole-3-glycerol phosphate synthase TrpC [Candidatus Hinthialibacter antarcticus]
MQGILVEIIEHKRAEVEARKAQTPLEALIEQAQSAPPCRDFHAALKRDPDGPLKLLAEIKAASPSAGSINKNFDAAETARLFEDCGASAISVLTDLKYFSGTDQHLQAAKAAVSLPVLRKDFTIDEYQLYESRAIGADAVLLMAQVLPPDDYKRLYDKADELGLHVLAEGHTVEQIAFLASIGAQTIGVNNRDFETMTVDLNTTLSRRRLVPSGRVVVSQSGVFTRDDVARLETVRVDAIQVGTSIMKSGDMKQQIADLIG